MEQTFDDEGNFLYQKFVVDASPVYVVTDDDSVAMDQTIEKVFCENWYKLNLSSWQV